MYVYIIGPFKLELVFMHYKKIGAGTPAVLSYKLYDEKWNPAKSIFYGTDYLSYYKPACCPGAAHCLMFVLGLSPQEAKEQGVDFHYEFTPEQYAWCKKRGKKLQEAVLAREESMGGVGWRRALKGGM